MANVAHMWERLATAVVDYVKTSPVEGAKMSP